MQDARDDLPVVLAFRPGLVAGMNGSITAHCASESQNRSAIAASELRAAAVCLIADTSPVAYGSLGLPITVLATVTGLPLHALSLIVSRQTRRRTKETGHGATSIR